MKAGRKGNLNVATEVHDNYASCYSLAGIVSFFVIFTYSYILIRYFKWHLLFIWLRCGKQKGTPWSFIRYPSVVFCFSIDYFFISLTF